MAYFISDPFKSLYENEFKKTHIFPSEERIFEMMSRMYLFKDLKEGQVGENFRKRRTFQELGEWIVGKMLKASQNVAAILEIHL